jgi:hypothetical protein
MSPALTSVASEALSSIAIASLSSFGEYLPEPPQDAHSSLFSSSILPFPSHMAHIVMLITILQRADTKAIFPILPNRMAIK